MSLYNPSKYIVSLFLIGILFTVLNLTINMAGFIAPADNGTTFIMWLWFPGVPVAFFIAATIWLIIAAQYARGPSGGGFYL